jgi:DNA-directed RNA polymerase specialized sigma24 family protein
VSAGAGQLTVISSSIASLMRAAALEELTAQFPRAARVVQLRFLCDLTIEAVATELALSPGTVKRDWNFARAWLAAALEERQAPDDRSSPEFI